MSVSQSSSDSDESEYIDQEALKKKLQGKKIIPRNSVSAEVYGRFNQKKSFVPKVVTKTEVQKNKIRERLVQAFMFGSLDEKEKKIVIDAMEIVQVGSGEVVIKQGDAGDKLFVVDQGSLDCYKVFPGNSKETFLKIYSPGESFGELALLYNVPRAATIKARERSILFSLDRECFNHIVKDSASKKRDKYLEFLNKVELFNCLDTYEKSKICDCLNNLVFKAGEYIIRQVKRS